MKECSGNNMDNIWFLLQLVLRRNSDYLPPNFRMREDALFAINKELGTWPHSLISSMLSLSPSQSMYFFRLTSFSQKPLST